jgi:hypothetical protein
MSYENYRASQRIAQELFGAIIIGFSSSYKISPNRQPSWQKNIK